MTIPEGFVEGFEGFDGGFEPMFIGVLHSLKGFFHLSSEPCKNPIYTAETWKKPFRPFKVVDSKPLNHKRNPSKPFMNPSEENRQV